MPARAVDPEFAHIVEADHVIGAADPLVAYSGYVGGTYDGESHTQFVTVSGVGGDGVLYGANLSGTNAGSYSQDWSYGDNPNYNVASGTLAFDIAKADATIVVNGYTGVYDGNAHGATGSATEVIGPPRSGCGGSEPRRGCPRAA